MKCPEPTHWLQALLSLYPMSLLDAVAGSASLCTSVAPISSMSKTGVDNQPFN